MISRVTSLYFCGWTALGTFTLTVGARDWRTLAALALGYTLPRIVEVQQVTLNEWRR